VISFLEGRVVHKTGDRVVLAVAGIGYEVFVPVSLLAALPVVGEGALIHTRMIVREDATTLFGFASTADRDLFDLLTGVSGVGPKMALSFLSALSPLEFRRAVAAGDTAALVVVPGVGKKTAQRVVLELRDVLGAAAEPVADGSLAEVREALLALGLSPPEASEALAGLDMDEVEARETPELLREALQKVGR
jgi:Holliday junction DNA helicase RuvA